MSENVKIKAGGVYRTRGGDRATVENHLHGDEDFPFLATVGNWRYPVTKAGCYFRPSYSKERSLMDLVESWVEAVPAAKPDNGRVLDESKPAGFNAEHFKPGDWVKVVWGDIALEAKGVSLGDAVQVEEVRWGFVHLTKNIGAWYPARFEPASAPQVQPTTPEKAPDVSLKDTNPKEEEESSESEKSDAVFRPKHFTRLYPEPVTVINAWGMGFNLGNAVKYISRAGHKDDLVQDLRKAIRYLEIEIECVTRRKAVESGGPKELLIKTL